jgi:hypothetical protein
MRTTLQSQDSGFGGPGMWDPMPLTPPTRPPGEGTEPLIWSKPEAAPAPAPAAKPAAPKPAAKKKPARKAKAARRPVKKAAKPKKKAKTARAKKR